MMQALVYKLDVVAEAVPSWLVPNDPVALALEPDRSVGVYVQPPERWVPFLPPARPVRIGCLGPRGSDLLRPALEAGARLRVRVVDLAHHTTAGAPQRRVALSVWGEAGALAGADPA
jgi:hypothetical protein